MCCCPSMDNKEKLSDDLVEKMCWIVVTKPYQRCINLWDHNLHCCTFFHCQKQYFSATMFEKSAGPKNSILGFHGFVLHNDCYCSIAIICVSCDTLNSDIYRPKKKFLEGKVLLGGGVGKSHISWDMSHYGLLGYLLPGLPYCPLQLTSGGHHCRPVQTCSLEALNPHPYQC